LATSLAHEANSFSYALGNESLEAQPEDQLDDGINVVICHPVRNLNSVSFAMSTFACPAKI
jgi:hypothetical protein